jgi:hypothetical protein
VSCVTAAGAYTVQRAAGLPTGGGAPQLALVDEDGDTVVVSASLPSGLRLRLKRYGVGGVLTDVAPTQQAGRPAPPKQNAKKESGAGGHKGSVASRREVESGAPAPAPPPKARGGAPAPPAVSQAPRQARHATQTPLRLTIIPVRPLLLPHPCTSRPNRVSWCWVLVWNLQCDKSQRAGGDGPGRR